MQRALELETQLSQAQPNAEKCLEIDWLTDDHDCESCGSAFSQGAEVRLNGKVMLSLLPLAMCFGSESYHEIDIYQAILNHLGFTVTTRHIEDEAEETDESNTD